MYNMLVFIMSTVIQSFVGIIIDMFEPTATGYNPAGYTAAILVVTAILAFSVIWALVYRKKYDEIKY